MPGARPRRVLLVGAPGFRTTNGTVGRVYALQLPANATALTPLFSVTGVRHAAEFGHALAVNASAGAAVVAVGSPGADAARGRVDVLPLGAALRGNVLLPGVPGRVVLVPDAEERPTHGRFGQTLDFASGRALFVSTPLWNKDEVDAVEAGAVHAWLHAPTAGAATPPKADWSLLGTRRHARLGTALAVLNSSAVVVGAPRDNTAAGEMAGTATIHTWR